MKARTTFGEGPDTLPSATALNMLRSDNANNTGVYRTLLSSWYTRYARHRHRTCSCDCRGSATHTKRTHPEACAEIPCTCEIPSSLQLCSPGLGLAWRNEGAAPLGALSSDLLTFVAIRLSFHIIVYSQLLHQLVISRISSKPIFSWLSGHFQTKVSLAL